MNAATGRRPRLLMVCHYYPPHIGGIEVVAQHEAHAMTERGYDVEVLTSACGDVDGVRNEAGVCVRRVAAWNGLEASGVPFPVWSPALVVHAWRSVRRADVVHVHDSLYLICWLTALLCRVLRTPYVVTQHVGVVEHPSLVVALVQRLVFGTLATSVLHGANRLIPINRFVRQHVASMLPEAAGAPVLRNGVDTQAFRPPEPGEARRLRHDLGVPLDAPLVLFLGRFVPKKGFEAALGALSERYTMVFAGGVRPEQVPEDDRAVFVGRLDREQVARVYRAVDLFVGASVGESPLTVLEAMSSGLPVLLHEDPGYRALEVGHEGATYADLRDGSLRDQLEAMLADAEQLRVKGRGARATALASFSWESHVDALSMVYDEVLSAERVAS